MNYRSLFTVHCSLFTVSDRSSPVTTVASQGGEWLRPVKPGLHSSQLLFTVHCSPFTVHCSLFTVHRSLFISSFQLPASSFQLFSPFTVHCSLFTVSDRSSPVTTVAPRREVVEGDQARPALFTVHCLLFTVYCSLFLTGQALSLR